MAIFLLGVAGIASIPLWLSPLGRFLAEQLAQHSEHFRVHQVVVTGNHWIPADTVLALANVPMNVPLVSVPMAAIEQRVTKHVWIASAQVRRMPPDLVEIHITEREPVAAIRSTNLLIATADGMAVAPVSNDWVWDLPLLTIPKGVEIKAGGAIRDPEIQLLLKQVVLLRATSPRIWHNLSEIHLFKNRVVATFSEPAVELLLGSDADELVWSYVLQFIENAPDESLTNARLLDARHPGHIIVKRDSPISQEHGIG